MPAASAASRSSRPSARAASVATIAEEKYGPGEHRATHFLLHDDRIDETQAEAAERLGDEEAGPAEIDDLAPQLRRDADVVVLGHLSRVLLRRFRGEKRTNRAAQRVLVGREREVHTFTVLPT